MGRTGTTTSFGGILVDAWPPCGRCLMKCGAVVSESGSNGEEELATERQRLLDSCCVSMNFFTVSENDEVECGLWSAVDAHGTWCDEEEHGKSGKGGLRVVNCAHCAQVQCISLV